jgi:hypothetical protein
MRRSKLQVDAIMGSGCAMFFLIGKHKHEELAKNVAATAQKIIRFRERHEPPFIAHLTYPEPKFAVGTHPGNVEMKLRLEDWIRGL